MLSLAGTNFIIWLAILVAATDHIGTQDVVVCRKALRISFVLAQASGCGNVTLCLRGRASVERIVARFKLLLREFALIAGLCHLVELPSGWHWQCSGCLISLDDLWCALILSAT